MMMSDWESVRQLKPTLWPWIAVFGAHSGCFTSGAQRAETCRESDSQGSVGDQEDHEALSP